MTSIMHAQKHGSQQFANGYPVNNLC